MKDQDKTKRGIYPMSAIVLLIAVWGCGPGSPTETVPMVSDPSVSTIVALTATWAPAPSATPLSTASEQDGMTMVYVPAGEFLMGSVAKEVELAAEKNAQSQSFIDAFQGFDDDERPQHRVYLDAFWIDQTEVTNEMYAAFLNDMGNRTEGGVAWLSDRAALGLTKPAAGGWQPGEGYADHPVVGVTWYGARAYCAWADRRLPTEAEWEKAARGTDGGRYPWGNGLPTCELANFDGGCFLRVTTAVGSYPDGQSPYGALDMAGNVWEWTADWYSKVYYASSPDRNPPGPPSGEWRVIRGASWYPHQYDVRAANRARYQPSHSNQDVGFRCALDGGQ